MMESNNSTLKSEMLSNFKSELNDTLQRNNNTLSTKLSNDLDQKFMQFQSYLMKSVKELVTEMSLLHTSSKSPTNVSSPTTILPTPSPPMQASPNSQNPGGYSWQKYIIPPQFSPPKFMTQSSLKSVSSPVNITPTQANNKIHREVNELISKSTSLVD